jgi:hypothetical protein
MILHGDVSHNSFASVLLCPISTESTINRLPMTNFDTYLRPYDTIPFFNPLLVNDLAMYSSLLYHPFASISSRFEAQRSALQYLSTPRNSFWQTLLHGATLSRIHIPFENPNLTGLAESFSIRSSEFSAPDFDGEKKRSKARKT